MTETTTLIDEVPEGYAKMSDWTVGPDLVMSGGYRMNGVEPVAMAQLGFVGGSGRNWAKGGSYLDPAHSWLQAVVFVFSAPDGARRAHERGIGRGPGGRRFTISEVRGAIGTLYEHAWGDRRAFVSIPHGNSLYSLGVNTRDAGETMELIEAWAWAQHKILEAPGQDGG